MTDSEARLTELEIKLSHQDVLIEDLRQALGLHHEAIEKLEKRMKILLDRNEGKPAVGPGNEKPPHY
ncbi:MAG: SlyX family protein [Bdellovibrionota bacterium]